GGQGGGGGRHRGRPGTARGHRPGPARGAAPARAGRGGRPGRGDRVRDATDAAAMKHYRRLLGYLRPYVWPYGIIALGCMLVSNAVEGAIPLLAKYTLHQVVPH